MTQLVGKRQVADTGTISARLDRLPATRAVWKLILLLSLGFFFELYDLLFTGYVAPGLVKSGILSPTTSGLFGMSGVASFIAALFCGQFLGTVACSFLADRFGRRAIFTWSLLWYVAANTVMAFQDTASGLNFWRFVSGMGIGVELITIGTYMSELAPKHLRGRAFAICQTIGFSAVPVVAFLSYLLVPKAPFGLDGWRWVALLGGISALFVWYFRRNLPESPRWLASKGRIREADEVLARLEEKVARQHGQPLPEPGPADPVPRKASFADMWKPPYRSRTVMLILFHIPDSRLLRLCELGTDSARQARYYGDVQPAVHDSHRACSATRTVAWLLDCGPLRTQARDCRHGGTEYRQWPVFQSGSVGRRDRCARRSSDAGGQHHFLHLPHVPAGTHGAANPGQVA